MIARLEAIYEDGVFKPLSPPNGIAEDSKVCITVEPVTPIEQFRGLVKIDPAIAAGIIENADYAFSKADISIIDSVGIVF